MSQPSRSTFCTQYIACDRCYDKLTRKLKFKEKGIYAGKPHRYMGQTNARMFSGCFINGRGHEDVISILAKAVICCPLRIVFLSDDGSIKEMLIMPLEINKEKKNGN